MRRLRKVARVYFYARSDELKFGDIREVLPVGHYFTHISWNYFPKWVEENKPIIPDYQRGYVWIEQQQIDYCEAILKGCPSGRDIYFNHPDWMGGYDGDLEILDGQQRIGAVTAFLNNKIKVFGNYFNEYKDKIRSHICFGVHILKFQTRKEKLEFYLAFNNGGTIHTKDELDKVRNLLLEAL